MNNKINLEYTKQPEWVEEFDFERHFEDYKKCNDYYHWRVSRYYNYIDSNNNRETFSQLAFDLASIEDVENYSNLTFDYDPSFEEVKFVEIKVYRDGKWIDKGKDAKVEILHRENELESLVYSGNKTLSIMLYDIRVGDILLYSYQRVGDNPVFKDYFTLYLRSKNRYDCFFEEYIVVLDKKIDSKLEIRYFNGAPEYKKEEKNDLIYYKDRRVEQKAIKVYDREPSWYIKWGLAIFTNSHSWEEVVNWALDIYNDSIYESSEDIDRVVQDCKNYSSNKAKQVEYALSFVQESIRYFSDSSGLGGIVPVSAKESLKMRLADCKNKVVLLKSILNQLDIESYPVLVDTYDKHKIKEYGATPAAFNHMIILAKIDDKEYWLDATKTSQGGNLEHIVQADYGYGLVLRSGDKDLTKMDIKNIRYSEIKHTFDLREESAKMTIISKYYGIEADYVRSLTKGKELNSFRESHLNYFKEIYPEIQVETPIYTEDNSQENIFTVYESYDLGRAWIFDKEENEYYFIFRNPEINSSYWVPESIRRDSPYAMLYPLEVTESRDIYLPKDYAFDKITTAKEDNKFFYFEKSESYDKKKHLLKQKYKYKAKVEVVEAKDTQEYKKLTNKIYGSYTIWDYDPYDESGYLSAKNIAPNKQKPYIKVMQEYDFTQEKPILNVVTKYYDYEAKYLNRKLNSKGEKSLSESYLDFYKYYHKGIKEKKSAEFEFSEDGKVATVKEYYILDSMWDEDYEDEKMIYLPNDHIAHAYKYPKSDEKEPIKVDFPSFIELTKSVNVGKKLSLKRVRFKEKNKFFNYSRELDIAKDKKSFTARYSYQSLKEIIEPKEFKKYRQKTDVIDDAFKLSEDDIDELDFWQKLFLILFSLFAIYVIFKMFS